MSTQATTIPAAVATFVTLALVLASSPPSLALDFSFDAGIATDDNVNKAESSEDIREDTLFSAAGGISFQQILSLTSALVYRAGLGVEQFTEFDKLNNLSLTGALDYKLQFSRGYLAPRYTLTASVQEQDFESNMRDSTTLGVQASVVKRWTDRIATAAGLGYKTRESESEVFDNDSVRVFANLDYTVSERILGYATVNYVSGDVVSTSSPTVDIINAAAAIEPDDAFGGTRTGQFAYKLEADTTLFTLGANYGLGQTASIDASVELLDSQADGNNEYQRTTFRISYLGIF